LLKTLPTHSLYIIWKIYWFPVKTCTWKREITLYLRDALVLCSMKNNTSNKNEITAIIPSILPTHSLYIIWTIYCCCVTIFQLQYGSSDYI
jgi:hypothetical protein